uniref:Protein OS-9-like n=1 Tax=Saccoglossus kowalevskii TaxID=10224 RepID=A0ABM0GKV4_SACKO|nr:PREDICTED: protein OS-9-like [Saccoglossus kowalevskii]
MATPTAKCLLTAVFSLNIALFCANFISFFDLDELDDVKYGIDIINTPVLSGKADDSNIMYMKSKYGQQYECKLPDMEDHEKEQEEEKLASEIGISELLKPMEAQPCLIKTKGWWTYEFCYRKTIRQYHMDDGNIIGDVISLGNYHSEMDWSTNSNSSETKRHKINRYHSHLYKNGSVCDLTQRQRESEVRFMCDEVGLDTIHRVDEPSSCMYLITIHTNRVCKHPFLRPPTSLKPKPILCYPALNKEQFDEFTDKQNLFNLSKVFALHYFSSHLCHRKPPAEDTLAVTISTEFLKLEEDDKKDDKKVEKEVEQKEDGEDDEEEASIETEEEEDALLVKEFKEGLDEIKPDKAKLAEMSDKLHESILDQFDDILAETQEDFNDDSIFDHIDYKVAAKKLAATLTTLLESIDDKQVLNEKRRKLDENEKDAAENSEKKVRTARGGYGIDDDDDDDDDDDKETTGKKVPTSTGGIGLTDDYEDDDDDDDRVRVRVTKVNIAGEQMQKETEIYDSKYRKIEKAVQEDLENAGINPDGKIEVKIIAYDPNDDESGMTVLSEEETTYFKDMIIGILGGGQETTNEAIRHQRLEDNYNFVWGETSSSQQSTLDSDDAE